MPPSGALMIGVSQTVERGVTQGFEYLRSSPPRRRLSRQRLVGQDGDRVSVRRRDRRQNVGPRKMTWSSRSSIPSRTYSRSGFPIVAPRKAGCTRRSKARSTAPSTRSPIRCAASTASRVSSCAEGNGAAVRAGNVREAARGGQGHRAAALLLGNEHLKAGAAARAALHLARAVAQDWNSRRRGSSTARRSPRPAAATKRSPPIGRAWRSPPGGATSRPKRRCGCSRDASRNEIP